MSEKKSSVKKFIKNFLRWFEVKPKLEIDKERPLFQEREVWMCHLGTNIGFEIDGKHDEALRPVLVFKKLSRETAIIIPITSKLKDGSWFSPSSVKDIEGRYCLNQIRMIDAKRLKYWIERIDNNDFQKVRLDFKKLINL